MILNQETFEKVGSLLAAEKYPTAHIAYAGAETLRDGNRHVPVVWFDCRDKRVTPRKGQRVAVTEKFDIAFTKPLTYSVSIGGKSFSVACSKSGRTVSRRN